MDDEEVGPPTGSPGENGGASPVHSESTDANTALATDPSALAADSSETPNEASVSGITVESSEDQRRLPSLPYPLVAIGASAGGLQAFRDVLENLLPETGMTFVLVTHLAPDQRSYLTEIMERHTKMPVLPVEEGQRPVPNHVYILLPNQFVRLQNGVFRLEERQLSDRAPSTIDIFFRSVAIDMKHHAIGVVLSGADSDGALGLKTIKGEGGIALVQSPASALHSSMPRNSIAADHVDLILPPDEIALELARLGYQFTRPDVLVLEDGKTPAGDEQAFQRILQLLHELSGIELRLYKPETIRRRMGRRMMLLRIDTLTEYHRLLQVRTDELRKLQEDVLIGVTRFFRDPDIWESIRENVLPGVFQNRPSGKPLRVWCAGCSSGEEAYSLAMVVLEYATENGLDTPIQIFGTDSGDRSIEIARTAIYPHTVANEISAERLHRFFIKVDRGYQVSKRVRDLCIFARQNLSNDPPFSHIDILSCRNVMIYFNQVLQRQVMSTFHYALDPGAYLILGLSEGLRDQSELFTPVDRKSKIFSKAGVSSSEYDLPRRYRAPSSAMTRDAGSEAGAAWPELELQRAADRIVVARFGPPGLIVDERLTVLQVRGQTSPFIDLVPGAVSWNLQRVLREDIAAPVRQAVLRAIEENIPVSTSFTTIGAPAGQPPLNVDVLPISVTGMTPRCFLILLQTGEDKSKERRTTPSLSPPLSDDERGKLLAQLQHDLSATQFHLQSIVQERDARNQELVSANEEIQASNEELQSTNEELGTTKEELQSANEELQTVNDELQQRNAILAQTGNDLNNLLTSVNIPLLMLTGDLRIRQFTPPMQRLLSVRPTDIGRPIGEITFHLGIENLETILQGVMETLGTHEVEVQDDGGRWYLLRVRPYRTSDDKIEGLVMILLDIDQLRRSQEGFLDARDFARSIVDTMPVPVVVLKDDCSIETTNSAFRELASMRASELSGRSFPDLVELLWGMKEIAPHLDGLMQSELGKQFEMDFTSTTADRRTLQVKGQVLQTGGHRVILLVLADITIQRQAEQLLSQENESLESQIESAAIQLGRTQEELRSLTAHLFSVQEEERQKVARELHDDISQRLSLLELLLNDLPQEAAKTGDGLTKFASIREQVQTLNTDVRDISHRLHPALLDDLGLPAALKALIDEFRDREGTPATFISKNLPPLPSQPALTALYRIAQEALRNVAKHAGKTHVKVMLEAQENRLRLEVADFGIGFDQESPGQITERGLGLISMKERAHLAQGTLIVRSSLGYGTTVTADVPFERNA